MLSLFDRVISFAHMDSLLEAKDKLALPISKSQSCNALSTLGHIPKIRGPDLHYNMGLKNSVSVSTRLSNNLVAFPHLNNTEFDIQHDLLEALKKNLQSKKPDIVAMIMENAQRRLSSKCFSQFLASLHQIGLLEKTLKICLDRPSKALKESLSPQSDQWGPYLLRQNMSDAGWVHNVSQVNLLQNFYSNPFKFKQEFEEHEVLGKGGFGVVVKAKRKFDGACYAVKKIKFRMKHIASSHTILREVRALAQLDHPNICRYYNSWIEIEEEFLWGAEGMGAAKALDAQTVQASEKEETSVKIKEISVSTEARILAEKKVLRTSSSSLSNSNATTPVTTRKSFSARASMDNSIVFEDSKQSNNNSYNSADSRANPYRETSEVTEDSSATGTGTGAESQQTDTSSDQTAAINGDSSSSELGYDSDDDQEPKILSPVPFKKDNMKSVKMVLYIQMQYYSNSTLADFLQSETRTIEIGQVRKIFHQIVEGVREIHSKGFIHRDLKPKNIFLSDDHTVKIGDFGLSKPLIDSLPKSLSGSAENSEKALIISNSSSTDHTFGLGTASYASPEQLHGSSYDHKADMFSLGIILFELLSQFGTASERIFAIKQLREEILSEEFASKFPQESMVIKSLISKLPHLRPNAVDLLNNVNLWSSNTEVEKLKEKLSSSEEIIQSQSAKISQLEEQIKLLQAKMTDCKTTSA